MSDKKIYGQLVALTKEVKLREPKDGSGRMAQFIAGKNDLYNFSGGIGITWWHTVKAFEICRNIASMAISKHQELQDGDIEELSNIVQNTLRQNCLNNSLFNGDDILLSRKENLFESRSIDNVENFSKKLWEHIFENFKKINNVLVYCLSYP